MSGSIESRPLSPALGVIVENYDFPNVPTPDFSAALRDLLWEHHLLLFPSVDIDPLQQRMVVQAFGPVADEFGNGQYFSLARADISSESNDGGELAYHSDFGFTASPLEVISLYGMDVPAISARTAFANGIRASRELPADLRARLQGKLVLHAADVTAGNPISSGRLQPKDLSTGQYTGALYPALFPHPKTGKEILLLDDYMSIRFEGMSHGESKELLITALAHFHRPEYIYTHTWRRGDLIVFDNIALSHRREPGLPRTLRRMVVGESPFLSVLPAAMRNRGVAMG